jgi:hypothetical protein
MCGEDNRQGRKSLRMCWTRVLRVGWFDLVAEASKLPDHSRSALLLCIWRRRSPIVDRGFARGIFLMPNG